MVARHDLATDPELKSALLLARRGTAQFGRKLNELRDEDLDGPSLFPGWSRRHLVAHVAYQARALVTLAERAGGRQDPSSVTSELEQEELIAFGSTLAPLALRNLFFHSAVHLDVEWRDTTPDSWQRPVNLSNENEASLADTVLLRAHEVWRHAVDLDNGARWEDLPPGVSNYRPTTGTKILACLSEGGAPANIHCDRPEVVDLVV